MIVRSWICSGCDELHERDVNAARSILIGSRCRTSIFVNESLPWLIPPSNAYRESRIFGYQAEEVIGIPITIIVPTELHEDERRILQKVRSGERIEHFDTIRLTKHGRLIPISLTVSPADGQCQGPVYPQQRVYFRTRAALALPACKVCEIASGRGWRPRFARV